MSEFFSSSLPNQAVNYKRKKNDKLAKKTSDVLERIGRAQIRNNAKLNDYYKMAEGKLVWADYSDESFDDIPGIKGLVAPNVEIPTFVKHYDILGPITNQKVGEWLSNKDDFSVDCSDTYTDNELLRERTRMYEEYTQQQFELEVKYVLAERGFSEKTEFQSEEEQQQYMQQLQQIRDSIKTPEQIEKEAKTYKTQAVHWANSVMENDYIRFDMEELDREEMRDYSLTGRFFRNYFVGYDYYKPERWDPREVFFSQDLDATKPQELEYIGRQYRIPIYKIKERFGHKISTDDIKKLDSYYNYIDNKSKQESLNSERGLKNALFGEGEMLPFYNFPEFKDAMEFQDMIGMPMGRNISEDEYGNEVETPYYIDPNFNYHSRFGDSVIQRDDINVRTDTCLITESYYKSMKKMYIARYKDSDGVYVTDIFSAELLPEFIEQNNLKKDTSKSIEEIQEELENDTIYPLFVPEVRQSVVINTGGIGKEYKIYFDDVLPYQIKGHSNIFDVRLPVAGIIDPNFLANKIRPYQIAHNICLNQIMNMMEKELGLFFLFDINLLPSEYKVYGDTTEAMAKLQEFIKDTSLAPIDTSKQNTQQGNISQSNMFMYQDMSYTNHIQARMTWAQEYKRLAWEQAGMTPQRMGNPSQYETATGVQQGVEASYAQTAGEDSKMSVARLKAMELHLAVAQYCQKEYKDQDFVYTASDGNKAFVHLSDPYFPLRRIGVFPINDSRRRAQRDTLIQTLMQTNTMGNDILDYAQLFTAKSTQEILETGRKARMAKIAEEEAERAHEQELIDKQTASVEKVKAMEIANENEQKELDRQNKIDVAEITAIGRASYQGQADSESITAIKQESEEALRRTEMESKIVQGNRTLDIKENIEKSKLELQKEQINIKNKEIDQKREQSQIDLLIAQTNKN